MKPGISGKPQFWLFKLFWAGSHISRSYFLEIWTWPWLEIVHTNGLRPTLRITYQLVCLRANSAPRALKKRSDYYHPRFIVLLNNCNHMKGSYSSPNFAKKNIYFSIRRFSEKSAPRKMKKRQLIYNISSWGIWIWTRIFHWYDSHLIHYRDSKPLKCQK